MKISRPIFLLLSISLNVPACSDNNADPFVAAQETTLKETTDANGSTSATFDADSKSDQALAVNQSNLATSGVKLTLKAGTLATSAPIFIEEGLSPVVGISNDLAISETPEKESNPIVVRTDDESIIPASPLTLNIPMFSAALHLADKQLVVFYIAFTKDGQKSGLISPDKVTVVANKASFSSPYFGVYQLVYLAALPEKTEATSSQKVTVKPPPSTEPAQTMYIAGKLENRAGYWKEGTWTELGLEAQGKSEGTGIVLNDKGDVYVSGAVEVKDSGAGDPGYWKNGTWNPLKLPTGFASCNAMKILVNANVHLAGTCFKATGAGVAATYWKDGVVATLATTLANADTSTIAGISVDSAGLISITGDQSNATDKSVGYWKDSKFVELEKKALTAKPGAQTPTSARLFNSKGKDYILGSDDSTSGVWSEAKFTASENFLTDIFVSKSDDVYTPSTTAAKFGYFKNEDFTAIAKPKADAKALNSGFLRVSKRGEVILTGDYTDGTGLTLGYWKDGTWATLKEKADADADLISDIFLF